MTGIPRHARGQPTHRFALFAAIVVSLAIVLTASACGAAQTARRTSPQGAPDTSPSTDVVVPDVITAVAKHRFTPRYTQDPDATALMLEAYVEGFLESAGLEPDVRLQPIAIPDSQEPSPGVLVPRGSVVRVRIGFGD